MSDMERARFIAAFASYHPDFTGGGLRYPALASLAADRKPPRILRLQHAVAREVVATVDPQSYGGRMAKMVGRVCYASVQYAHPPVVLRPSESLARRLDATDVDALKPGEIRMPFPVVGIVIPAWMRVRPEYKSTLCLVSKALTVDRATGREHLVVAIEHINELPGGFVTDLDYCDDLSAFRRTVPVRGMLDESRAKDRVMSFVFATLLYMQTQQATVTNRGRVISATSLVLPPVRTSAKLHHRELSAACAARRMVLGADAQPFVGHANTMVRGHFRNQACGPRHSERRVIWIEPHFRFRDESFPVLGRDVEMNMTT